MCLAKQLISHTDPECRKHSSTGEESRKPLGATGTVLQLPRARGPVSPSTFPPLPSQNPAPPLPSPDST